MEISKKELMRKSKKWILLSICIFGVFIPGCATNEVSVKVYTGPDRPDSETVLLTCDYENFFYLAPRYGATIKKNMGFQ
jgi:hypothetical protein